MSARPASGVDRRSSNPGVVTSAVDEREGKKEGVNPTSNGKTLRQRLRNRRGLVDNPGATTSPSGAAPRGQSPPNRPLLPTQPTYLPTPLSLSANPSQGGGVRLLSALDPRAKPRKRPISATPAPQRGRTNNTPHSPRLVKKDARAATRRQLAAH